MKKLLLFIFALFLWTGAWADGYYVVGTMNNWSLNASYKLSANPNATGEYMITGLNLSKTDQFKIVYSADDVNKSDSYYPQNDPNYGANGEITANGYYSIYFKPTGNVDGWYHGCFYVAKDEYTYTAKFANSIGWYEVYAYTYGPETLGTWPGTKMDLVDNVYTKSFTNVAPEKIIFNNGDNPGVVGLSKTSNLDFVNNKVEDLAALATSGSGSSDPIASGTNAGKTLNYTWEFTQTGMDVTVTFACTNTGEESIIGINSGYVQDVSTGLIEHAGLSYTWKNCTPGQIIKAQHKWEYAEGLWTSPSHAYIVKDNTTPIADITSITVTAAESSIEVGETTQLTVKDNNNIIVFPSNITFTSNNEKVTIDANGLVTAVAAGEATITATLKDKTSINNTVDITIEPPFVPVVEAPVTSSENVVSIYGSYYDAATTLNYAEWNSGASQEEITDTNGKKLTHVTNFNYLGYEYSSTVEITGKTFLHVEIYPIDIDKISFDLITGNTPGYQEAYINKNLTANTWNKFDIPLSNQTTRNDDGHIYTRQFKFAKNNGDSWDGNKEFFFTNIYYYTVPAPEGVCTEDAEDVYAVYSDVYSATSTMSVGGGTRGEISNPGWNGGYKTATQFDLGASDKAIVVEGATCFGLQAGNTDISAYDLLKVSIYSSKNYNGHIKIEGTNAALENLPIALVAGQWNNLRIPLSGTRTGATWVQMYVGSEQDNNVIIDNMYFSKFGDNEYIIKTSGNVAKVLGNVTASNSGSIAADAGSSAVIDVSEANISENVTITPTNVNAVVIVGGTGRTPNTKGEKVTVSNGNLVVYDGSYRRSATGHVITLVDNNNYQPAYDFTIDAQADGFTYERTIGADKWVSYNSPAPVTIPASVTVYKATDATSTSVTFTKQDNHNLGANDPVILHNTTGSPIDIISNNIKSDLNLTANPGGAAVNGTSVIQYGTARAISTDGSQFALSNGELHPFNGGSIGAFRVYYTGLSTAGAKASAVFVDGETTTIGSIDANGEINVMDGAVYNLAGQRVAHPTKGIYIVNGKKVLIK